MSVLFKDEGKVLHNQNPENYASDKYFYDVSNDLLMELLKIVLMFLLLMKKIHLIIFICI